MSRRFIRLSLLSVLLFAAEVWAIGLGDIKLDSALNEPLRADIELLGASADELSDLSVTLASAETFARYGIDRPFFLQAIEFSVVNNGTGGGVVEIRSSAAITEPFLTFLVEANWPGGRLLREYTVLLDPPTYVAPSVQQPSAVEAPRRSTPSDSGRIDRQSTPTPTPSARQAPAPQPAQPSRSTAGNTGATSGVSAPPVDDSPYDTRGGGDLVVQKGQTLWGLAASNRPDGRLTMNQTMLAIYEANRDSFGGNINLLKAGASIRIPSADEVFRINRGDALSEVQRQHSAWDGSSNAADFTATGSAGTTTTQPDLVLVPPDEEPAGSAYDDSTSTYEPLTREQEVQNRIDELVAADVPDQQSLLEIRDNELAALRQELADIRGEVYEPPVDDTATDDGPVDDATADQVFVDDATQDGIDDVMGDDTDDTAAEDDTAETTTEVPSDVVRTSSSRDESIVDKAVAFLLGSWGIIIGAVVLVIGGLIWFMRRGDDDDVDIDRPWETLDSDDLATTGTIAATSTMHAPVRDDDAIVVVEQDSGVHPVLEDTVEAPAADISAGDGDTSDSFGSLEDTFSSETAVNLDQTDPVAEADFHMAYGLYDQAADLINGALESDPNDTSLMSKLCEIYFVWGNRDAFVDAATRLKAAVGDGASTQWDKIVIMGQQIAADDALFAGAELAGAAQAVDLSLEEATDDGGALDMDFGADSSGSSEVIDLGADSSGDDLGANAETHQGVDFSFDEPSDPSAVDFDLDATADKPALDSTMTEATAEMPSPTVETPTIEEQFSDFTDSTSELPALDETSLSKAIKDSGRNADETAEINLDDLDLDIDGLAATELASLDDLDATGQNEALSDTGINEALENIDLADATGKNPEVDPDATGLIEGLDLSDTHGTGMRLAADETGQNPMDTSIDESLLDATGRTQVLSDTLAVDTGANIDGELSDSDATMLAPGLNIDEATGNIADDAETMLASLDEDDDDFDFAKTEALPPDAYTGKTDLEATADTPAIAGTDVDLDLDDLTAALKESEIGDTVEQPRDDATVEQPRPTMSDETAEIPTMSLAPEDMSTDLHEARTMTEVGTKLDLARAYVDMGDPAGARSILEEVLDEGDSGQKQQAQQLLDSLPG